MAIEIRETFEVRTPIDAVWRFLMDPHRVVTCMPGASLDQVLDERTFLGSVKVRVGAITTSYQGRIRLTEVDEAARAVHMSAEGRETGGGTAKGTISSRLRALGDDHTEVVTEASVDLTGRIMQVGRGMIQGVAHQLFLQFVAATRAQLEAPAGAAVEPSPAQSEPIRVLPLLLRSVVAAFARLFRRLFGRSST